MRGTNEIEHVYTFVRNEIAALHYKHVVNSKATVSFSKGYSLLLEFNFCTAVYTVLYIVFNRVYALSKNRNASPKVVRGKGKLENNFKAKKQTINLSNDQQMEKGSDIM